MGVIGTIRKHSAIAVTVVGIAIVAFIIGDLRKNSRQEKFAKIDGDEVTYNYFNSVVNQREETLRMYGLKNYALKEVVWQEIVQDKVLGKEMDALGIQVGDKEMNDMFLGRFIPASLQQQLANPQTGAYDKEYVRMIISQFPQLPDTMEFKHRWLELEQSVRKERRQDKYFNMYMPQAVASQIALIDAKRVSVEVASLMYSQAKEESATLTDEDIKNYFNKHKKEVNADFFRGEIRELRDVVYAVFTAQPTQEDMAEIDGEVSEWWAKIPELEGDELKDFVNMHGVYDTMYYSSDLFVAPLDSVISGSHAGTLIEPTVVNGLTKNVP